MVVVVVVGQMTMMQGVFALLSRMSWRGRGAGRGAGGETRAAPLCSQIQRRGVHLRTPELTLHPRCSLRLPRCQWHTLQFLSISSLSLLQISGRNSFIILILNDAVSDFFPFARIGDLNLFTLLFRNPLKHSPADPHHSPANTNPPQQVVHSRS